MAVVPGEVDDGDMSVLSQRSARVDLVRSATVAVLAVVQVLVSVMVGGSVGAVAESLRTPLLAAGWAFTIWAPIYAGVKARRTLELSRPSSSHRRAARRTAPRSLTPHNGPSANNVSYSSRTSPDPDA